MATIEEKLAELGIDLAEFKPFHPAVAAGVVTGNLLYVSGATPKSAHLFGRVGDELTTEQGYEAARECAIGQLGYAKATIGDLSRIKRVVKVLVMVNSVPGFTGTPAVAHGASDFYREIFGEDGSHARSAVGLVGLPFNGSVEVETIFELS